ncbi:MAG: hypothetical protein JO010_02140 [Alphaproteobacteria bacterium]|nr:hypothetical protein [Alphaproteobacteria bacterium]
MSKFDRAPDGFWTDVVERRMPEGWRLGRQFVGASFAFFPIFPSTMMFTKALLRRVGMFDVRLREVRPEDWEFTTRCLFTASIGAVPQPTVKIRKHAGNASGNQTLVLVDEIFLLARFKRMPEARPYLEIIDQEIIKRSAQASDGAFAAGDYSLLRRVIQNVPPHERSLKLKLKHAIAVLPLKRTAPRRHA